MHCERGARLRIALVALMLAAGEAAAEHDTRPILTAAIPRNVPPNYSLDDNRRPEGFAIDVMELIAREAGVEIRYQVEETWDRAIETLRRGQVDLIPNLGITDERRKDLSFSTPLETIRLSLFVRADTYNIRDPADLRGRGVAVVKSNAGEELLRARSDIRLAVYPDFTEALFALLSGNVDALVFPEPWTWSQARAARVADEIKVVGEPLLEIKRALAVRADDADLLERLAPAIQSVLAGPEYRTVYAKWIGTPEPYWTARRQAMAAAGVIAFIVLVMALWRYRSIMHLNRVLKVALDERERAEAGRERSAHLAETAMLAADMGSWDWDVQRNQVAWSDNVEEIFRIPKGSFRGTYEAFIDLVTPEDRDRVMARVADALSRHDDYRVEYRILTPTGETRWLVSYGRGEYDRDGKPTRLSGIVWDTTHRKLAEQEREKLIRELEQRTREMESFVYTISHDLKSPLITIEGFATLLAKDIARNDQERARDSLTEIQNAAHGMQHLIEDLLSLSRTGQILGQPEDVDLRALILEIKTRCAAQIEQARAVIRIDRTLPHVHVDRWRMGQVFQNLLENAVKFHRSGVAPLVEVGAEYKPDAVYVYVRDNGIGIEKQYHEKIFGLFERLNTQLPGTGVGLTIARRIVEQHGGRLWVESMPGQGSTFWISLPDSVIVDISAKASPRKQQAPS